MQFKRKKGDDRTHEQIREHYEIEKELATKLRQAPREERGKLYTSLYDELFKRVPHHSNLTRKASESKTRKAVDKQIGFLKRFLKQDLRFLEVGPGDCQLSFAVARRVRKVYAVDISRELTSQMQVPDNFELIISDGRMIPLEDATVDLVYSNQLMEHLHPEDAVEQLQHIFRVLAPDGQYVCITPNKLYGPCDISRYFDQEATCFHLKEYTTVELAQLFRKTGFRRVKTYVGTRGVFLRFPYVLIAAFETFLKLLPYRPRKAIASRHPFRLFLGIRVVGVK